MNQLLFVLSFLTLVSLTMLFYPAALDYATPISLWLITTVLTAAVVHWVYKHAKPHG